MTTMFVDPDPAPTPRKQLHASWNGVPILVYIRYLNPFLDIWTARFEDESRLCFAYGETREIAIANLVEHLMERGA